MDETTIPTYRTPTPTEERAEAELANLRAQTHEIEARMARAAEVARQADERTALRKRSLELTVARG